MMSSLEIKVFLEVFPSVLRTLTLTVSELNSS